MMALMIVPAKILTKFHLILHMISQNNGQAMIENTMVNTIITMKNMKMLLLMIAPGRDVLEESGIFCLLNSNIPFRAWRTLRL